MYVGGVLTVILGWIVMFGRERWKLRHCARKNSSTKSSPQVPGRRKTFFTGLTCRLRHSIPFDMSLELGAQVLLFAA